MSVFQTAPRWAAGIAVLAGAGLILIGCAAPQTGTDAGGSDADPGELSIALGDSITNLYPGIEAGVANYWVAAATAEGLVTTDAAGNLAPALATSWEQTDPTTYVFQIDDSAVFQDGDPMTMADVLTSIDVAKNPETSPSIVSWANVDTVEQTDDWEVTITLLEPDASFIFGPSSASGLFVFPESYWESAGDSLGTAEALPVATGPYQITEFSPDSSITLERSEHWDGDESAYDTINFSIIPNENTRLLAMENGDANLSLSVPIQQVDQWEQSDAIDVTFAPNRSYVGITFDTAVAPFDDQNVRDAIAHSFDRQALVDQVLGGHGEPATALLTPAHMETVFSPEESRELLADMPQYPFDLEAAADSLAKSGDPDGFTVDLVYPDSFPDLQLSAELLKQNLAEIDITLNTKSITTNEWFSTMGDREHGIGFMSYFSTTADPAEMTNWFLGPENLASFSSEELDAALAEAHEATSSEDQLLALVETNRLQAEANVYAPLWWGEQAIATDGSVEFEGFTSYALFTTWPTQLKPAA